MRIAPAFVCVVAALAVLLGLLPGYAEYGIGLVRGNSVAGDEQLRKTVETQAGVILALELIPLSASKQPEFITLCEEDDCSDKPLPRSHQAEFVTLCENDDCEDRTSLPRLPLGTQVKVCFKVNTNGYVTLWSIDAKREVDRLYPNKLSHPQTPRAAQATADTSICVGEDERFRLRISPPVGRSQIYLHWTRTEAAALGSGDHPSIGKDLDASPYHAAAVVEFEIVDEN